MNRHIIPLIFLIFSTFSVFSADFTGTTVIEKSEGFYIEEFDEYSEIFSQIYGKSFKENCTVPIKDLRLIHILYTGFDGTTYQGELICNKFIAENLIEIFEELYESSYPIEKIQLVDNFDADDESSMRENNSSCFNFRFVTGSTKISKHGLGLAIDINPLYNPCVRTKNGTTIVEPATAQKFVDRSKNFPHKIDKNDLAYKIFTAHGFEWGGSWGSVKDYQHFELPDYLIKNIYPEY